MSIKHVKGLDAQRQATKAAKRADTARRIASGELTPEAAQQEAAPYTVAPLKTANMWKHLIKSQKRKP